MKKMLILIIAMFLLVPALVNADELIWSEDGEEFNSTLWNVFEGSEPTNFTAGVMLMDANTVSMETIIPFPNTTNAVWYMEINYSVPVTGGPINKIWGAIQNKTLDFGGNNGIRLQEGSTTCISLLSTLCYRNPGGAEFVHYFAGSGFVLQNWTLNVTSGNYTIFNTHVSGGTTINGSFLAIAPSPIDHLRLGRNGDGGFKVSISSIKLYNVTPEAVAVPDTTPPDVTIIAPSPENNSFSTSIIQVFNLSIIEPNLDTITLNFNGTNETGFVNDFSTFFSLTKNTMAEGLFTYQIHVNDTSGNEFVSELLQFTVDNTSPTIIYTLPLPDNSTIITDLTGNVDILGFNINLDLANLTIFNLTNEIIFQNVTSSILTDSFTFVNSFSEIFTTQPDANYTFRTCFIDSVNIETCQEVDMELFTFVAPPPITAQVVLPLEGPANIVAMLALIFLVLGLFLSAKKRK